MLAESVRATRSSSGGRPRQRKPRSTIFNIGLWTFLCILWMHGTGKTCTAQIAGAESRAGSLHYGTSAKHQSIHGVCDWLAALCSSDASRNTRVNECALCGKMQVLLSIRSYRLLSPLVSEWRLAEILAADQTLTSSEATSSTMPRDRYEMEG